MVPTAGTLLPPKKKFPGEVRGYQEPSGARHRQTGQDIPQEPLPPPRQGRRRLEWPPWPQQEEPPAPDESPWTKQDKTRQVKMFLWAQHDLKTALLAVTGGLDPRG